MIAHLRGKILVKHPNQVVVEAGGVGYDVVISVPTYSDLPNSGAEVALHIRMCARIKFRFMDFCTLRRRRFLKN
jgi:Holliday junction DNA helicase RuvA